MPIFWFNDFNRIPIALIPSLRFLRPSVPDIYLAALKECGTLTDACTHFNLNRRPTGALAPTLYWRAHQSQGSCYLKKRPLPRMMTRPWKQGS